MAHILHSDSSGGGPVSISRMLRYFHASQDQVMLAGGRGRIYETCQALGIPYYQIPLETKTKALAFGLASLVWRLRQLKPDILVVHGQWGGPLGALAGRLAGVRRLIYVARWPAFYTSWDVVRAVRNHYSELVPCRLSDWTVTLSESNRYQYLLRRHVDPERLLMIPNAISPEDRPTGHDVAQFRQRWGWREEHCHVVSAGRLSDQKRVMWLVQAWPEVVRCCPQARLWIVGDGPRRVFLERLAHELGISSTCRFLGEQPTAMVALASADVVAMTSVYESRGNVAMEAMLCGRPIVASDVDGLRDTIHSGEDGFLIRPGDVHGLARQLVTLIENPELRQRIGAAARQSMKRYDVPEVMAQYEALFAEAMMTIK